LYLIRIVDLLGALSDGLSRQSGWVSADLQQLSSIIILIVEKTYALLDGFVVAGALPRKRVYRQHALDAAVGFQGTMVH